MTTTARAAAEPVEAPAAPSDQRRWVTPALLAAVFVGHLLLSRPIPGVFLSDGTGYLADARWLARVAGETFQGQTGFYHPGYSFLLAPLFRLFDDPDTVHQGVLVVNAALATSAVLVYRALAARLGLRPRPALAAGLVAALYPAVLLQASVEWSENLYHLGFGLLLLAVERLLRRRDHLAAAATGFLAVGLYATHPRGLGLVPVVLGTLAVLGWRGLISRRVAVTGIVTLLVAFVAARILFEQLLAMWPAERPETEADILGRLTEPTLLWGMVKRAFGHAWYLLVATAGLGAAGLVKLAADARQAAFARVTLLLLAATFAASALMMSDGTRVDHLVYGRYNEGFVPALLVFGTAGIARWKGTRTLLGLAAGTVAAIAALGLVLVALEGGDRFTGLVAPLNVFGILVWETERAAVDLLRVSAGAAVVTVVVVVLRRRALRLTLLAAGAFFLGSTLLVRDQVLVPFVQHWAAQHELAEVALTLPDEGPVAYERAAYRPDPGNFYQFKLFDRGVRFWDRQGTPPGTLVLGTRDSEALETLGARVVSIEAGDDTSLWVVPGALQDRLLAEGRAFPGRPGDPLPDEARRAELDSPGTVRVGRGEQAVVAVEVTHAGRGSPWAARSTVDDPGGAVRLLATWPDGTSHLGELPTVVPPGETVEVELLLPPRAEAGRYDVRLTLVQGPAALRGSRTVTVEVR